MAKRSRKPKQWAPRAEGIREARIHCRVPARIHTALRRAAEHNAWTLSAETVHRLAESFALSATRTQAILAIVGYAIDDVVTSGANGDAWLTDPVLHREARAAMTAAFDLLAPQGEAATPAEAEPHAPNGRIAFEMWWDEVRRYDPKTPIDTTRPRRAAHQRRLIWLREALGMLPDRVVLWGKTGREARRAQLLSLPEYKEFVRLARTRIENKLTQEQLKRLQELFNKAPPELTQRLQATSPAVWGDLSNPGPFGKIIPTDSERSEP